MADQRIFGAALVERDGNLGLHERIECLKLGGEVGLPVLVDGAHELRGRVKRALIDLHLQSGGIDPEHGDADTGMAGAADLDSIGKPAGREAIDG